MTLEVELASDLARGTPSATCGDWHAPVASAVAAARRRPMSETLRSWGWSGANLAIPSAMLVYAAAADLACRALGHGGNFRLDLYVMPFYASYLLYAATLGAILWLRQKQGRLDRRLLFFPGGLAPRDLVARMTAAAPFLLALPVFMTAFTGVKNLLNDSLAFTWDQRLSSLGAYLLFGRHLWQWLDIRNPVLTHLLEFSYAMWGVLLVAVPFAVCLRRPDCRIRNRFLISYLLVLVLLGNAAAGMFMSAGPFVFHLKAAGEHGFDGLFAYLSQADPDGNFSAVAFQEYLWQARQHGMTYLGTGISAFPSVHVAIATLDAVFAWQFGRVARIASLAFLGAIMVGAIHLGWHYSLDLVGGALGALAIYAAVGRILRDRRADPIPAYRLGRA